MLCSGGNFLGIRLQFGATVQTKGMWRVVGVPDQWSAEDLCRVLAKANRLLLMVTPSFADNRKPFAALSGKCMGFFFAVCCLSAR